MSVDYSSLWDGFEPVSIRITREQKTLKDISAWWAKRAAIEDAYGKSLQKLGKAPIGKGEQGTISSTLEALRREAEETGGLHSQFAATIKMELAKGTDSFFSTQKKSTSKTLNRGLTLTKNLANSKIKEAKSKDGYYRYAQQAKFDERFAKKASDCEQDYYKRVQTLRDSQSQFYSEMPGVLADLQRVDEQSLDQMQRTWDSFVDILERNIPALQDIVNALKNGLSVFDKDRDMKEFYDKCYTGAEKPPLVEYQPFDKGPKESSYNSNNTWGGKSSNTGGGSDFGYAKSSTFSNSNSNGSYVREPLQLTGPKTGKTGSSVPPKGKKRHSRLSTLFTAPTEVVANTKDFDPESYYDQKNFYNNNQQDQGYGGETYKYNAMYEFVGDASDELSLMPGDVLDVYAEEGGWLFGTNQRGEQGRFPASYCQYAP